MFVDMLLRFFSDRKVAISDITLWHSCGHPIFPVKLIDGLISDSARPLWRRFNDGHWEYQQDAETEAEWEARGV